MLRSLKSPHLGTILKAFKVTFSGSGGDATVNVGGGDMASATDTGAGGIVLFSAKETEMRRVGVFVSPFTNSVDGGLVNYNTTPTGSAFRMQCLTADGSTGDPCTAFVMTVDYTSENTDRTSPIQVAYNTRKSPRLMAFKVSSAGAVVVGGTQGTVSKASSVYTTTFQNAFGADCMVWCTPIASAQKTAKPTAVSASTCAVATFDSSEAAEDNDFYMVVLGWDANEEQWGMRRAVQVPQLEPRMECIRVVGTGTAAITVGTTDATLVDNGTGDYTLTWTKPFAREPIVIVTGKDYRGQCKSAATTTSVNIGMFNGTGSAVDDEFNVLVIGYDSQMEV